MLYAGFALFFLLYAAMCFYVAFKKPPKLIKIVKLKLGNISDEGAVKASYAAAVVALVIAIVLLVIKP